MSKKTSITAFIFVKLNGQPEEIKVLTSVFCLINLYFFSQQFVLTPRTEEKYNKINQEFDQMMKKNLLQPVSLCVLKFVLTCKRMPIKFSTKSFEVE